MANIHSFWSGESQQSRRIVERIVVEGDLVLLEPAHFGNGDAGDLVDMPLLVDARDPTRPLLTGATLAGALRSYLRAREFGYRAALPSLHDKLAISNERQSAAVLLFGGYKGDDDGEQSRLIVDDALGVLPVSNAVEVRDGVRIKDASHTADDNGLFSLECWAAGTTFPLRFELLVSEHIADRAKLMQVFATALEALADGEINFGARKRRGYGKARVDGWRVSRFNFSTPKGLLEWIEKGSEGLDAHPTKTNLQEALDHPGSLADARQFFQIKATMALSGSLLIRSSTGASGSPDMVHLHARQAASGEPEPILSGTSLGGALRARARKICRTLHLEEQIVEEVFGIDMQKNSADPIASRLSIRQAVIEGGRSDLVQNRVSIDRFTGGSFPSALFNQQPVFGREEATLELDMTLVKPKSEEIGLLLFLLKDLWTEDVPLGGEHSVGRGRLCGKDATLIFQRGGDTQEWQLTTTAGSLQIDGADKAQLEAFAEAFTHLPLAQVA